jgi:nucleotide-binding universal stress UspA family protein
MLKVAVALDFSFATPDILNQAKKLVQGNQAHLWLLHVEAPDPDFVGYDVGPQSVRDSVATEMHQHHIKLQDLAAQCRLEGLETTALLLQGPTVQALAEKSVELGIDFLVVGSHGHGLKQLILGSVSDGLLKQAPCPVVVVRCTD